MRRLDLASSFRLGVSKTLLTENILQALSMSSSASKPKKPSATDVGSTDGAVFYSKVPQRIAGYLGFRNTDQLFAFYESSDFQNVIQHFPAASTHDLTIVKTIVHGGLREAVGRKDADTEDFSALEYKAHCILRLIKDCQDTQQRVPVFGGLDAEEVHEKYARALACMRFFRYTQSNSKKKQYWGGARANKAAEKTRFMIKHDEAVQQAVQFREDMALEKEKQYAPFTFTTTWLNFAEEQRANHFAANVIPVPEKASKLADPRISDGPEVQDRLRRALNLHRHRLDIVEMNVYFEDDVFDYCEDDVYDYFHNWAEVRDRLRSSDVTELDTVKFDFVTMKVEGDDEIFERDIPEAFEDTSVTELGTETSKSVVMHL